MSSFKVFKLSIARALIDKGFRCIEILPNKDIPWFNIYGFENTPELRAALDEIIRN